MGKFSYQKYQLVKYKNSRKFFVILGSWLFLLLNKVN